MENATYPMMWNVRFTLKLLIGKSFSKKTFKYQIPLDSVLFFTSVVI
jgi:hypothetical protein